MKQQSTERAGRGGAFTWWRASGCRAGAASWGPASGAPAPPGPGPSRRAGPGSWRRPAAGAARCSWPPAAAPGSAWWRRRTSAERPPRCRSRAASAASSPHPASKSRGLDRRSEICKCTVRHRWIESCTNMVSAEDFVLSMKTNKNRWANLASCCDIARSIVKRLWQLFYASRAINFITIVFCRGG